MKKKTAKKLPKKKAVLLRTFKIKALIKVVKHLVSSNITNKIRQEYNSLTFCEFLKKLKPATLKTHAIKNNSPLYRVTTRDPISTSGSLTYGGRYNVGGSQQIRSIGIRPFAALYFSTDLQCAIDEYEQGIPLGPGDKKYILTPSKEFVLWDIDKIIQFIQFPNLQYLINQGPLSNDWGYCKVPMQSQILGNWLKKIGGDGIIFNSTQSQNSKCIAIFAKDDNHAKKLFPQIKKI